MFSLRLSRVPVIIVHLAGVAAGLCPVTPADTTWLMRSGFINSFGSFLEIGWRRLYIYMVSVNERALPGVLGSFIINTFCVPSFSLTFYTNRRRVCVCEAPVCQRRVRSVV